MKIASHAPSRCSGCFLQEPAETHVDLEVSYDGPYVPGAPPVSIDDNILCAKCVRRAAELIGLVDPGEAEARVEELEAKIGELEARAASDEDLIAALERVAELREARGDTSPERDRDTPVQAEGGIPQPEPALPVGDPVPEGDPAAVEPPEAPEVAVEPERPAPVGGHRDPADGEDTDTVSGEKPATEDVAAAADTPADEVPPADVKDEDERKPVREESKPKPPAKQRQKSTRRGGKGA